MVFKMERIITQKEGIKNVVQLVQANDQLLDAFHCYACECAAADMPDFLGAARMPDIHLNRLQQHARGENLPDGFVPYESWFLMSDQGRMLGSIRYRPRLTAFWFLVAGHIGYDVSPLHQGQGYGKLMLRILLQRLANIGNKQVIITCQEQNISSQKVVMGADGEYLNSVWYEPENAHILRYRINIEHALQIMPA